MFLGRGATDRKVLPFAVRETADNRSRRDVAGVAGFEPTNAGVKDPCLTPWLHPSDRSLT